MAPAASASARAASSMATAFSRNALASSSFRIWSMVADRCFSRSELRPNKGWRICRTAAAWGLRLTDGGFGRGWPRVSQATTRTDAHRQIAVVSSQMYRCAVARLQTHMGTVLYPFSHRGAGH